MPKHKAGKPPKSKKGKCKECRKKHGKCNCKKESQVAKLLPPQEEEDIILAHARQSGIYMLCVFTLNGNRVQMYRNSSNFPAEEYTTCVDHLDAKLRERLQQLGLDDK